nr:MAG TPA: co-chaperonin [Herelleviridae sp.]
MDRPKVRLLADRLLVEVVNDTTEQRTVGGIILPNTSKNEQAMVGKVLAISKKIEKCKVEEDKVAVGEQVLFSKYAGTEMSYKGKDFRVLRITDIIGAEE